MSLKHFGYWQISPKYFPVFFSCRFSNLCRSFFRVVSSQSFHVFISFSRCNFCNSFLYFNSGFLRLSRLTFGTSRILLYSSFTYNRYLSFPKMDLCISKFAFSSSFSSSFLRNMFSSFRIFHCFVFRQSFWTLLKFFLLCLLYLNYSCFSKRLPQFFLLLFLFQSTPGNRVTLTEFRFSTILETNNTFST